jgi:hypothetical protein
MTAIIDESNMITLKSLISENQKIRYTQIKFIERFLKLYSRSQNFNGYEVRVFQAHDELPDYETIEIGQFKTWMIQKTRFFKDGKFFEPLTFFIRNLNTQIELNAIENAYFEFRDFSKPKEYDKSKRIDSSWERPLENSLSITSRQKLEQFPILGQTNPRVASIISQKENSSVSHKMKIAGSGNSRPNEFKMIEQAPVIDEVSFIDSVTLSIYRNITKPSIKDEFIKIFESIGFESEMSNLRNESFNLIRTIEDNVTLKIYRGMKLKGEVSKEIAEIFEAINMMSESSLWKNKHDDQ